MLGGIYGLFRVGARLYRNAVLHSGARLRPREAWAVNRRDRSRRGAGRRGCYRPARGSLDCALADSTKRACMSRTFRRPARRHLWMGRHVFPPVSSDAQTPPQDERDQNTPIWAASLRTDVAARSPIAMPLCVKDFVALSVQWVPGLPAPVVGWKRAREWLGRRAGAWGVSRPRWRQSRSPRALPGSLPGARCGPAGVGLEAGEDDVAEAALEGAQGFFRCLAFGQFPLVVGAAGAVAVADLGDCGHVDGVVEAAVAAP